MSIAPRLGNCSQDRRNPVHSKRCESVVSLIRSESDRSFKFNLAASWQGNVWHARISMLSKLCQIVRVSLPWRSEYPRYTGPNRPTLDSSHRSDLLRPAQDRSSLSLCG